MAEAKQGFEDLSDIALAHPLLDGQQDGVFAPEAGEGKNAGDGQAADQKGPMRNRQAMPQAAQAANVDHAAHRVHHAAGTEEQAGP